MPIQLPTINESQWYISTFKVAKAKGNSLSSGDDYCNSMKAKKSILRNKKVGVIGFNARPLACSVKRSGGLAFVSDYWGDSDLDECSREWVSVLSSVPGSRQRGTLEDPLHISLSDNFQHTYADQELDYVLIGSGFDDHSTSLDQIENKYGITGNSPLLMQIARNRDRLSDLATNNEINYPRYRQVQTRDEAIEAAKENGFPCVIRPTASGGGTGIRKISGFKQLDSFYDRLLETDRLGPRIVQDYVLGLDVSASVLCTGTDAYCLSIQEQLIGLPSAGRHSDFVYCGNRIPANLEERILKKIRRVSEQISASLGLKGSIGIDYVVSHNGELWLLEVNPRFQGSLEMLERSANISVSELHILACNGELPQKVPEYTPTTKMIVYANRDGTVPDLSTYSGTVDRSPTGVEVHKGDPVCSIIESGMNSDEVYKRVESIALKIQDTL
ncbi:MAG: ATP-grasp domain-containing protein [Candidatus Thorarchaeota archaeon]|nr:ATP-grasp domain-containing protein [Candidatus Thorarchaeota archaeon]